jgi:Suppressor of fused protein (SUFU)
MRIPPEEAALYPARIELIAYCEGAIVGAHDGQDMVSACLQSLAAMPFETEMFLGPLHTATLPEAISPNSDMSAFLFAVPDSVDMPRLCSCTPNAQLVVSVMPISLSERTYAVQHGPGRLIDLFAKNDIPNFFDPFRKAVA